MAGTLEFCLLVSLLLNHAVVTCGNGFSSAGSSDWELPESSQWTSSEDAAAVEYSGGGDDSDSEDVSNVLVVNGVSYEFVLARMTWYDAQVICEERHSNGKLALVQDPLTHHVLVDYILKDMAGSTSRKEYWIDGIKSGNTGSWSFQDGAQFSALGLGEPSNNKEDTCISMSWSLGYRFKALSCGGLYSFICQYGSVPVVREPIEHARDGNCAGKDIAAGTTNVESNIACCKACKETPGCISWAVRSASSGDCLMKYNVHKSGTVTMRRTNSSLLLSIVLLTTIILSTQLLDI